MTDTEKLLAIEEIRKLKYRYCRAIDTADWSLFTGLFLPDAVMDLSATGGANVTGERIRRSREEIVKFISATIAPGAHALHRGHMGEIEVTSDSTAEAIWAGEWDAWFADDNPLKERHGAGYYYEDYTKVDGQWFISSIKIDNVIHEEVISR